MTAVAGHVTTGRPAPVLPSADAPRPAGCPGWPRGSSCSASTKIPVTASRRRWCRRADGQVIQMSALLYGVACRIDGSRGADYHRGAGQRRPGPVPDRRPGPLSDYRQAAAPGHRRRRRDPGRPAEGQPAARAAGAGHAAARARGERRRGAADAAVPVARRRGRGQQHAGRGLLAVRRPRAGHRGPAGPARPGGPAGGDRPVGGFRPVPRVRARDRLPLRRRAARRDRRRHLPGLARVLHQRHRLLPAVPRRPGCAPTSAACTST